MIISGLLLVLLAVIAIRQANQAFFSAFIMTVLTLCCAAAAFGSYEWVGANWTSSLIDSWNPSYILPISLAAIFAVPLLLLRLGFDRLIKRSCLLPSLVDRLGGGLCGLITSFTMVGIAAICLQMIPFQNGSILDFSRVTAIDTKQHQEATPPPADETERGLWLNPDRFAASIGEVLSVGIFSGEQRFDEFHPNFVQTVGWVNATHAEISRYAPPGSLSVMHTSLIDHIYLRTETSSRGQDNTVTYDAKESPSGYEYRMVRVGLKPSARNTNKSHIFALRQFQLVGKIEGGSKLTQFHPIAIQQKDATQSINRHIYANKKGRTTWPVLHERYSPRKGNHGEVELVFELPNGFEPTFIEYKYSARASVNFDEETSTSSAKPAPKPVAPATTPSTLTATNGSDRSDSTTQPSRSNRRRRNRSTKSARGPNARVRTVGAISGGSTFGDALPMALTDYRKLKNADLKGKVMTSGHLVGFVDQQSSGTNPTVDKFDVPADKRLLHLSSVRLKARSTLGRAISQAITVAQNYYVQDASGNRYSIVGKYALAKVRNRDVVEVQYFRDPAGTIGGLGKFDRIKEKDLTKDDTFVLLFLVDPGVQIVLFSTGGSSTRSDNLTAENLIAPQ